MYQPSLQRRISSPLLGAIGLFAGLLVVAFFAAPRVEEVSPAAASRDVPAGAHISLTFSQPMDKVSVESRLTINPPRPGSYLWEGSTLTFRPEVPWSPGTTVDVQLAAGSRSARFLPILQSRAWSFIIGAPRIAYLWPAEGSAEIYARSPDGGEAEQLTDTTEGVLDFRLDSQGAQIVYAAARAGGESDLRLMDLATQEDRLLYGSPAGTVARAPCLSPDGRWLAFERYDLGTSGNAQFISGPGSVWVKQIDPETEAVQVGENDHSATTPGWTPKGWLYYQDRSLGAIAVVNVEQGTPPEPFNYVPNELGDPGTWTADGTAVVFPEIGYVPETVTVPGSPSEEQTILYSHLMRVEVDTGDTLDLSSRSGDLVEDASAVYSPDGEWLAFARKYMDSERWTLGRQLWIMRVDGSEAHPLTDEPDYNHSAIGWSPDSSTLVYMRFNQSDIAQPAEIWVIGADGEGAHSLATGGFSPRWMP
jgi:Tol biopolymer transport system component